jgi:hypothetical protein
MSNYSSEEEEDHRKIATLEDQEEVGKRLQESFSLLDLVARCHEAKKPDIFEELKG